MNEVEPQRECPRWDRCSVNHCPLDPFQDERQPHPGDKEPKCTIAKSIRNRIGKNYPDLLPRLGLTPREWAGAQAFARLSPAEKAQRAEAVRNALKSITATKTPKTT